MQATKVVASVFIASPFYLRYTRYLVLVQFVQMLKQRKRKVDKKQYYAVKNSLTYTEKEIIDYYELTWYLKQQIPTNQEVVDFINTKYEKEGKEHRLKHTALNYYFTRRQFTQQLTKRGIPYEQHTQEDLTPAQMAAAITVCNFADKRDTSDKLDQLGIKASQYYAWLRDPNFKNFVASLSDQNLENIRPQAVIELTKKIYAGDWQAVKFYLETTGAVNNNEAPQTEHLLKVLIEIIQEEVKDQATIARIAHRIKLAAQNRTLEVVDSPPEITSSVIEHDVELEAAKKKLGI